MSNTKRVTSGVPAGGQFATAVRSESEVSLTSSSEHRQTLAQQHRDAARRRDLTTVRDMARVIRSVHPDAAYLEMDVSDQGGDTIYPVAIRSADGTVIGDLDDGLTSRVNLEDLCSDLVDDDPWTEYRVHPFGKPARGMVGRPCLDLAGAAAITDADIGPVVPVAPEPELEQEQEMPRPQRSTQAAERAMAGWVDLPGEDTDPEEAADMRSSALSDALTDLRHWADTHGVDMDEELDRSYRGYHEEKANPWD